MRKTVLLLALMAAQISFAADERIKQVAYSENSVYRIQGVAFTSTQIQFGRDEIVLDVEGGDTGGWEVTVQDNVTNMVFLKPTVLGSHSNITVITNKHNYYFDVNSSKTLESTAGQTYALKFSYPLEERQQLKEKLALKQKEKEALLNEKIAPKAYNWDYAFHGDKAIMPAHVFDDGKFTYLELRDNQDVPAVFMVDNKQGQEAIVNVSRRGQYLVIHRLAPQFTLRAGDGHVASLFNNPLVDKKKRGLA